MADDDKDRLAQRSAPDNEADWQWFWSGIDKSHRGWKVVGPIEAVLTNWKAYAVGFGILAFMRGPEIIDFARELYFGVPQ